MGRGRPVIRMRSHQEQQRRRLLFFGIPFFAIGSSLIWYFTQPETSPTTHQDVISSIHEATPAPTATQTLSQISIPNNRQEASSAPPAIPEPEISNEVVLSRAIAPDQPKQVIQAEHEDTITKTTKPNTTESTEVVEIASKELEDTTPPAQNTTEVTTPTNTLIKNEGTVTKPSKVVAEKSQEPQQSIAHSTQEQKIINNAQVAQDPSTNNNTETAQSTNKAVTTTENREQPPQTIATEKSQETEKLASKESNTPQETNNSEQEQAEKKESIALSGKRGWIYAGQFRNGNWIKRGLMIDNQLPEAGSQYKLSWGSKLRNSPPRRKTASGSNLGKQIGFLQQGVAIQVVQVKQSGRKGHIWLEIEH